ncbi:hypothetical protein L3X38_029661 [Prunus dulcis]|uniref:Uncharacterized protein n=1 Tax=Prunus dulcis TaxID=3755 RepID=A0AAD4VSA3_PRUDU|nr:hypothetical protein L3X38_029656 [Prunus dulcis]KAI5330263.1 hypothetical protein L3X38_029661 [Prunus dulcis]
MQVSGKPHQSVTPLNLGDNQTNDASNFNAGVVGEDRSHRSTDAPNVDSEVMKENLSDTENTTVSSYRNQDGRKLAEGHSEATSV